jgi:hypothetical protein
VVQVAVKDKALLMGEAELTALQVVADIILHLLVQQLLDKDLEVETPQYKVMVPVVAEPVVLALMVALGMEVLA